MKLKEKKLQQKGRGKNKKIKNKEPKWKTKHLKNCN